MNLNKWLNDRRPNVPLLLEIAENNWITQTEIVRSSSPNGQSDYTMHVRTPNAAYNQWAIAKAGVHGCIEVMITGQLFLNGVKVLRFSDQTMEAFTHYDLNLPSKEYHQPFPVVVIDFPEEYCKRREIDLLTEQGNVKSIPQFAIVHKDVKQNLINLVVVYSNGFCNVCFTIKLEDNKELEQCWEHGVDKQNNLTEEETKQSNEIVRACLNACLLATHYGVVGGKADNQSYQQRTQDRLQRAQRRRDDKAIVSARADLAAIPFVYELDQHVKIFTTEETTSDSQHESTGRHVKPHWRRGHWRIQRFGEGLTQSKRIPIQAVLVNSHRVLAGDTSHMTYTATE